MILCGERREFGGGDDHARRAYWDAHRCAVAFFLRRVEVYSVETIGPIWRRGVLFDVARLMGVAALDRDFVITPEHLRECGVFAREKSR